MAQDLYMGFDLSTTQLKVLVIQSDLKLVHEAQATFDEDFASYGVSRGVLRGNKTDELEIYSPNSMWLEALDLVLQRLSKQDLDLSRVRAMSGAGMQHGTVFWSHEAEGLLSSLSADKSLFEQLAWESDSAPKAFSHPFSPNWQDHSTSRQCDAFEAQLDDATALADATGSCAHHRFSGPQILRFRQNQPEKYRKTARISLVSSFIATILLGKIAPIDIGDVCGMNLWQIKDGAWNEDLISLTAGEGEAEELKRKLGAVPEDGGGSFGKISKYFVEKYGFSPDCEVAPCTGDNLSTIIALPLRPTDAIVSLGTSTTFLMSTPEYKPHPSYHLMNHPTTGGLYMFMLCYQNGSNAREEIRNELNGQLPDDSSTTTTGSWDIFNDVVTERTMPLNQTSPDDTIKLGLFFPTPEIVPSLPAGTWTYLYDAVTNAILPVETETLLEGTDYSAAKKRNPSPWIHPTCTARAVLESQFLSVRLRSSPLVKSQQSPADGTMLPPQPRRIYLVGGGSVNRAIAKVCGEVLGGAEGVYRLDIGANACALGAAYKAVWARERREGETFEDLIGKRWNEEQFVRKIDVGYRAGLWEKYGEAVAAFQAMEDRVLAKHGMGKKKSST